MAAACLLSSCVSALRINKDDPASGGEFVHKPQYRPDHYELFGGCPSSNPKIAILVAGRASGMVQPAKTAGFRKHVLEYLHSKGARGLAEGSTPDVFVHVKTGEGQVVASREAAGPHTVVSHEMCEAAMQEMSVTSHMIEDGWGHTELKRPDCFKTKHQGSATVFSQAGYWHSIQNVFGLMAEQEKKMSDKYDIIIFHRPDHEWRHDVDWAKINSKPNLEIIMAPANFYGARSESVSCKHGHIWGDQMMILPRPASEPFMTLYDDLALSASPKICGIGQNEEVFSKTQKSLNAKGFNIDWTMARNAP